MLNLVIGHYFFLYLCVNAYLNEIVACHTLLPNLYYCWLP